LRQPIANEDNNTQTKDSNTKPHRWYF